MGIAINRRERRAEENRARKLATKADKWMILIDTALTYHKANQLAKADALYSEVPKGHRLYPDALHLRGLIAHKEGRLNEALALISIAIETKPGMPIYYSNLGNLLTEMGREDAAMVSYRKAIALQSDDAEVHFNLGLLFQKAHQLTEAERCYRIAIAHAPALADAHNNLGAVLRVRGKLDEAIACHRRALALNPASTAAMLNLGIALRQHGRDPEEVLALYLRALELQPDVAEGWHNLGLLLHEHGRRTEALDCSRHAIRLNPNLPDTHFTLAATLLSRGEMAEGWAEFEWRWYTAHQGAARRNFKQPQWRGGPAEGRTLLIHAEQGFGDTLQFCRYAPMAAAIGWRVIVEVQKPLVRLIRSLPGSMDVIAVGDQLPDFDMHCPMLSLPLAFGTIVETIPAPAKYFFPDPTEIARWRDRLGDDAGRNLRIGLVWSGNPRLQSADLAAVDRKRSLPPHYLERLAGIPGIEFVSLQKDGPPGPDSLGLLNVMSEIKDFADTAALIANLDLVISVDTAVAHLAASIGKPVWMMDRFDCCWRWLTDRVDSPWYPGMRIFRQAELGAWDGVLDQVATALRELAAASSCGSESLFESL